MKQSLPTFFFLEGLIFGESLRYFLPDGLLGSSSGEQFRFWNDENPALLRNEASLAVVWGTIRRWCHFAVGAVVQQGRATQGTTRSRDTVMLVCVFPLTCSHSVHPSCLLPGLFLSLCVRSLFGGHGYRLSRLG